MGKCALCFTIFSHPGNYFLAGTWLAPEPSQVLPAVIALKKYLSYPCKKLAKISAQVPRTTTRATPSGKLLSDLVQTWQIVQEKDAFNRASLGPLLRNIFAKKKKETTLTLSPPLHLRLQHDKASRDKNFPKSHQATTPYLMGQSPLGPGWAFPLLP